MDFKLKMVLMTLWVQISCSSGPIKSKGEIGTPLSPESGLYNSYGIETSTLFVVDKSTHRLLGVSLSDLSIKHQFELKNKEVDHCVSMDINEKFAIDFSKKHLNIYGVDGGIYDRPFNFQGTPSSVAYNPYTRTMIMQDNLGSVGVMKLAENGAIEKSWLGGPKLAENQTIIAGDLDKSGRLILSLSDGSISVVDIDSTLEKQAWQEVTFAPNLGLVNWISPDGGNGDLVLVASPTKIAIINLATRAIVEERTLDAGATIQAVSKAGRPHVYTIKNDLVSLYFLNAKGAIEVANLAQTSLADLKQSYMDSGATSLTMLFSSGKKSHSVIKLRLSDALVMVEKTIGTDGETSVNASSVFVNFNDPLGALELHNLENSDVKRLEGYNFDYIRGRN